MTLARVILAVLVPAGRSLTPDEIIAELRRLGALVEDDEPQAEGGHQRAPAGKPGVSRRSPHPRAAKRSGGVKTAARLSAFAAFLIRHWAESYA
jgi:hypothetical protein